MAIEMWLFLEDVYPGIIVIADSKNFTFSHLKQINVGVLRAIFQYYQVNITCSRNMDTSIH